MNLKRRRIKRGRVEIIPMIDTVVILLIFYMTFSRFVSQIKEDKVQLPVARAGEKLSLSPYTVNMLGDDRIVVAAREYRTADLPGLLRTFQETARKQDPAETISVVLRGQRTMPYKDLSAFMRACSATGIADVTFATIEAPR